MLQALLNPARPDPIGRHHPPADPTGKGTGAARTSEELRGRGLVELIDRIPKNTLPQTGGCDATVVVTMGLDTLLGGRKAASLDTGHRIPAGLARRLAARAGVIPAVLGSRSEVLDLGRKARLFTKKQRLAMAIQQDHHCAV